MKERYVNASEIGTYVFCAKSWQLSQIGAPSQDNAKQEEGIERHAAHSEQGAGAELSGRLAAAFCCYFCSRSARIKKIEITPRRTKYVHP